MATGSAHLAHGLLLKQTEASLKILDLGNGHGRKTLQQNDLIVQTN
jgi:hypothetical protein